MNLIKLYLIWIFGAYSILAEMQFAAIEVNPGVLVNNVLSTFSGETLIGCVRSCMSAAESSTCVTASYNTLTTECFHSNDALDQASAVPNPDIVAFIVDIKKDSPSSSGSYGTSFVTGFTENDIPGETQDVSIILVAPPETTVTALIQIVCIFVNEEVTFSGQIQRTYSYFDLGNNGTSKAAKGVEITSDLPMQVFAASGSSGSIDANLVLPYSALSTEYLVSSHPTGAGGSSELLIIATEDNTSVTIAVTTPVDITLNRFETYQYQDADVSGLLITSSAKVAVLSGHVCAFVPYPETGWCDILLEQMPSMSLLQTEYIVPYMKPRLQFQIQIIAVWDFTEVTISDMNGIQLYFMTLNTREIYTGVFTTSDTISITATGPVQVAQYGLGTTIDGLGDPSMMMIPGFNQFQTSYSFAVPDIFTSSSNNYAALIISTIPDGDILLDGIVIIPIATTLISVPGFGSYKVIYISITSGVAHALTHQDGSTPFGALLYGTPSATTEFSFPLGM